MSTVDLANLSLFPAARDQIIESRKRSFVQWNRGLPLEQYLQLHTVMDNYEHARDKLTTWVLAPRTDPQTLDFMCSCETFRRPAIVCRSSQNGSQTEDTVGYGIASVFTPVSKRGKGYAKHMMRLLHRVLAPRSALPAFPEAWGAPPEVPPSMGNARFSALYSDVGPEFYRVCSPDESTGEGWIVRDAKQTRWDVQSNDFKASNMDDWVWLSEEQVDHLWQMDAKIMEQEATALVLSQDQRVAFSFLPTEGVGLVSIRRTMNFGPELSPILPAKTWGVQTPDGGEAYIHDGVKAFATWTLELRGQPKVLQVTRIRTSEELFPSLLTKLLDAAKGAGVDQLEIWNLPRDLEPVAAVHGGITVSRDDHLPSFKWYGPERPEELVWLFNEKFAWC